MATLDTDVTQSSASPSSQQRQPRPQESPPQRRQNGSAEKSPAQRQNVGDGERAVSVAAGALLAALGLGRRNTTGLLTAAIGGAMLYRGVTGHCHTYQAMGVNTAEGQDGESYARKIAERGIHVEQAFLINRPAEELYRFWRNFENLPRIMSHLESVKVLDDRRSHWVARSHGVSKRFEWDAQITQDEPNTLIGWRSVPGSADVDNTGQIRFGKAIGDRGTEVHVVIDYLPPAGRISHWIASMLGQNPTRVVREDVRNFKRLMETGEVPTIIGQPHGTCKGRGERYTESEWKPLFF